MTDVPLGVHKPRHISPRRGSSKPNQITFDNAAREMVYLLVGKGADRVLREKDLFSQIEDLDRADQLGVKHEDIVAAIDWHIDKRVVTRFTRDDVTYLKIRNHGRGIVLRFT